MHQSRRSALLVPLLLPMLLCGAYGTVVTVQQGGAVTTLGQALGMVGTGDTINVVAGPAAYVEGTLLITTPNLTIQGTGGRPRWNGTRLVLGAAGITLRNLELDGQHAAGFKNLVRVNDTASNLLIESCVIVNPASGTGSGLIGGRTNQTNDPEWNDPGTCISLIDAGNVTIRNCNFECAPATGLYNQGVDTYHEVNVLSDGITLRSNLLIEGCTFQAHVRNIQLIGQHANVTIRNNDFNRVQMGAGTIDTPVLNGFSTDCILLIPHSTDLTEVTCDGLLIQDNRFNRAAGSVIFFFNGTVNNARILGNVYSDTIWAVDVIFKSAGNDCLLAGNVFSTTRYDLTASLSGSFVVELDQPIGTALGQNFETITFKDNHWKGANLIYIYARASITRMTIDGNVFDSCLGCDYFQASNMSNVRFVNNQSNGSNSSGDPSAAVGLASANNVVAGNLFRNGREAVEFHRNTGVTEDPLPGGGNLVADNIITDMNLCGIKEQNAAISGTALNRTNRSPYTLIGASANRYFNNTIAVNQTAAGIDVRTGGVSVYNNILFLNDAGITCASPIVSDFNLVAANGGGGGARNYLGLAVAGPHDIVNINPSFVDFLTRDFNLLASSAARNAGTRRGGPIREPDYTTELGAIQDIAIDTCVRPSAWELYR